MKYMILDSEVKVEPKTKGYSYKEMANHLGVTAKTLIIIFSSESYTHCLTRQRLYVKVNSTNEGVF